MNGAPLPQRKAIDYALQTVHGLAAAHEKGIVHRDLKPDNLFITKDGRVKILDFGLAKLLGPAEGNPSQTDVPTRRVDTEPGVVMGTIGYMSPEQLRGKPADHRSDIFSFGAILYEMLSGRRAFRGESTADTLSAILREDPPDLSETNQHINPALERIVSHCLEKNPEERFHSARDLAFAIEALSTSAGSLGSAATVLASLPAPRKNRRELLAWLVAGAFLIGAALFAWLYFRRVPAVDRPVRFVIALPENSTEVSNPVVSPDGQTIVFIGTLEGKRFLYTRALGSLRAQRLDGTEDASSAFWSPDNRYIAFVSNNKLRKIEVSGGPSQTLCEVQSAYGGTWNKSGDILVSFDTKGINRVSAAGGAPTPLLKLDESRKELAQAWPTFLPDGRHFLYQSWNGRPEDSAIYVTSIDGGERKFLLKADSSPHYAQGYLLFSRGSTLMAQSFDAEKLQLAGEPFPVVEQVAYNSSNSYSGVSVSENGVMSYLSGTVTSRQLFWVDRGGKQLGPVGSPGEYNDIVVSPDGKRVAIQRSVSGNFDIWLMDLARGVLSRFTFDATTEDNPVWSPDGKLVVFTAGPSGGTATPFNLYRKVSSGAGNQEILLTTDQSKEATDWSSDGRFIIYQTYAPETGSDIWVLPLFGDGKPYPLLQTEFEESQAVFSPDGRWFAYISNESGRTEVYVQTFPQTGGKWLISTAGGAQPRWRRDGKELFFIAPDKTLMAVDINAGSLLETSTPTRLFATQVSSYSAPSRYLVTADGQRFLINAPAEAASQTPINVVMNWTADLKK
jgi:Tol biopolymer transport system component